MAIVLATITLPTGASACSPVSLGELYSGARGSVLLQASLSGASGSSVSFKIYVQSTADNGVNWYDVACFAFTGGEPLILKDIVAILRYCLALRPCLVLTNGTAPLIRRPQHLAQLRGLAHPLRFRVSIDYPDEARHDAGRGFKNFRKALQGLKLLSEGGFDVGITRLQEIGEDAKATAGRYRQLLRKNGLREDLQIVALPDLGALRSVDPPLGPDLGTALSTPILPRHPRCEQCRGVGVDYIGEFA